MSFLNIRNWIRAVKQYSPEDVKLILIGCKCDMETYREVTKERGKALADELKIPFFETSAKTSEHVDEAFMTLAQDVKDHEMRKATVDVHPVNAQRGCCIL